MAGPRDRHEPDPLRGPKRWGKVARHGAGTLGEDQATASGAWRKAMEEARARQPAPPERDEPERWVRTDRNAKRARPEHVQQPRRGRGATVPREVVSELTR